MILKGKKQMKKIEYLQIEKIKPHPLNAALYGDGCDIELLESVKKQGILTPIIVTVSNVLISGHRRFNAAQMANFNTVPVIFSDVDEKDPLAVEEKIIEANKQRQKTAEQIAREYMKLKEIEAEKAKKRQLENLKRGEEIPVVLNSAERGKENGTARDIAAQKLGIKRDTAEKSAKIVKKIDELSDSGEKEKAEKIREELNNKSVNSAFQTAFHPPVQPHPIVTPVQPAQQEKTVKKETDRINGGGEWPKPNGNEQWLRAKIKALEEEAIKNQEEKEQLLSANKKLLEEIKQLSGPQPSGTVVPLFLHKKVVAENNRLKEENAKLREKLKYLKNNKEESNETDDLLPAEFES